MVELNIIVLEIMYFCEEKKKAPGKTFRFGLL